MNQFISICIPTYNQITYLDLLMRSIVAQDYKQFEVVISDDSSTDDVFNLVNTYHNQLPEQIRYYRNDPSLGSPANWNFALGQARYDIVKIMHHDDYFTYPHSLRKFAEAITSFSDNPAMVFSGGFTDNRGVFRNHTVSQERAVEMFQNPVKIFNENIFGSPSSLCLSGIKAEYKENLTWLVDTELFYRLIKKIPNIRYIDEPLITGVLSDHNLTNQLFEKAEIELQELRIILKTIPYYRLSDQMALIKTIVNKLRKYGIYSNKQFAEQCPNTTMDKWFKLAIIMMKINFIINKR